MFGKPLIALTQDDLLRFLDRRIKEHGYLEYKREPSKDNIEKAIAGLANTHGGFVIVGVDENTDTTPIVPPAGLLASSRPRESILDKATSAIYPPVFLEAVAVPVSSAPDERVVVVVHVPESVAGPHAIEGRTGVYLRVDAITKPTDGWNRRATVEQIDWLLRGRERAQALKREMLSILDRHAEPVRPATARQLSFSAVPAFPDGRVVIPRRELLARFGEFDVPADFYSGSFPTKQGGVLNTPMPTPGGVASRSRPSPDYWNYTEILDTGAILHFQSYASGGLLQDLAVFLWSAMRFSANFYQQVGYYGLVEVTATFDSLGGRELEFPERRWIIADRPIYPEDRFSTTVRMAAAELGERANSIAFDEFERFAWGLGLKLAPEDASRFRLPQPR